MDGRSSCASPGSLHLWEGPQTNPPEWTERATGLVADGKPGRAMASFLTEIIGLTAGKVEELKNAPRAYDVLPIVSATLPREAHALTSVDLPGLAAAVTARHCCCSVPRARPGPPTSLAP